MSGDKTKGGRTLYQWIERRVSEWALSYPAGNRPTIQETQTAQSFLFWLTSNYYMTLTPVGAFIDQWLTDREERTDQELRQYLADMEEGQRLDHEQELKEQEQADYSFSEQWYRDHGVD